MFVKGKKEIMTKLKNLLGLVAFTFAVCFMPNVYAAEETQQVNNWSDLSTCLKDSTHTVCQLSSSIEVAPDGSNIYMLSVEKAKTLDLQGFTLNASHIIFVQNSTLTVTGESTGKFIANQEKAMGIYLYGNATVSVENITMELQGIDPANSIVVQLGGASDSNHFTLKKSATIDAQNSSGIVVLDHVKDSTVDIEGKIKASIMGITINGNNKDTEDYPTITISDTAEITGDGIGIYGAGYGVWNITGATIDCGTGLSVRSGKFDITDATIKGNSEYDASTPASGGTNQSGDAIDIVTSHSGSYAGQIEIHISGDTTVSSQEGFAIREFGVDSGNADSTAAATKSLKSISIEDGTFDGKLGSVSITDEEFEEQTKGFITGGTFKRENEPDPSLKGSTLLAEHLKTDENGEVVPEQVTVKLYDGATEKGTATKTYEDKVLENLPEVLKENLTFEGWYYDASLTEKVGANDIMPEDKVEDGVLKLYAKYVVTVSYHDGGFDSFTVEIGKPVGSLEAGPVQTKKKFVGWYDNADFEGEAYTNATTVDHNVTLYAKYINLYDVTFSGVTRDPETLEEGSPVGELEAPTAEEIPANHRFKGWYMDEEGETEFDPNAPVTKDTTIYAIFVEQVTITVVDVNGEEHAVKLDKGAPLYTAEGWEELQEELGQEGKILFGYSYKVELEDGTTETQYIETLYKVVEEDLTLYPYYGFEIIVNGEEFFVIEGTKLSTASNFEEFAKPGKTLIGFKDEEGNFYGFDFVPILGLKLTPVYKAISSPNTLDNVLSYIYMIIISLISMVSALAIYKKSVREQ